MKLNQEKIMKRRMISAIVFAIISLTALFVFVGLYSEEKSKIQIKYREQYIENLLEAHNELDTYLQKNTDYELHYNMVLSDLGAARSFIFLMNNKDDKMNIAEKQKTINEFHYCFVKYPEQMSKKLKDADTAIFDIAYGLDKGYDEAQAVVDSINKLGT